jgi:hypothetical protein
VERTEYTKLEIEFGLEQFIEKVNELVNEYYKKNFSNLEPETVSLAGGRTYWKLVKNATVYGFVRKSDGAILKAASWRAPYVKGNNYVRGYVTDSDFGAHAATPYGVRYQSGAGI